MAIAAPSSDRLDRVAGGLGDAAGTALPVPTEVADRQAVDTLVARTLDAFGHVDVLVDNAAIEQPGSIEELTVEQWRKVIDVNVNGVFYATKAVYGPMKTRGSGYIVNISSVAGLRGFANTSSYCATKFALTS